MEIIVEDITGINKIIEWCNINTGFFSAIIATLNFILSVLAITISIISFNSQFKNRLSVNHYMDEKEDQHTIYITIINIGSNTIKLNSATIKFKKKQICYQPLLDKDIKIVPLESNQIVLSFNYNLSSYKEALKKITIIIEDVSGKKYSYKCNWAVG